MYKCVSCDFHENYMTGSDIVFVFLMDTIQYKLKKLYNTNKKNYSMYIEIIHYKYKIIENNGKKLKYCKI